MKIPGYIIFTVSFYSLTATAQTRKPTPPALVQDTLRINLAQPVPANYSTKNFGFFCRQELRMKKAGLPVKIRLGSADYCNYLEKKTGYKLPKY